MAVPDVLLGERLAGASDDPITLRSTLSARGTNPLLSGAFLPRRRLAIA
jgi:hypothetical protein